MVPRKNSLAIVFIALLLLLTVGGCGFVADGPYGWGLTNTKLPIAKGPASGGVRTGEACVFAFMGMLAIGDASIETAMRNGGIKDVYTIDANIQSFFGTYTRDCTVVIGN